MPNTSPTLLTPFLTGAGKYVPLILSNEAVSELGANYSGVIIDQNKKPVESLSIGNSWFYQTFRLPTNFRRGDEAEEWQYPSLSGFQILSEIKEGFASSASLNYSLDYYIFGSGWANLIKGTVTGFHADGPKVWADILFSNPVEITAATASGLFRVGFQSNSRSAEGIEEVWFSHPNPLSNGEATESDGKALAFESKSYSFCFRLLGLTADSGTDFLGNPYRSVVVQSNAKSVGSSNSGYWLSAPQPSQFAVANLYFDVRPFPYLPSYGATNLIPNPSFEYDKLEAAPYWWKTFGAEFGTFKVSKEWASSGVQSLHLIGSIPSESSAGIEGPTGSEGIKVKPNLTYSVLSSSHGELPAGISTESRIAWYNEEGKLIELSDGSSKVTSPPTAVYASPQLAVVNSTKESKEVHVFFDAALFALGEVAAYFDGDSVDCRWSAQNGRSASIELKEQESENNIVVIDGLLLDPLVPNTAFNVYYSTDGAAEPTTTEEEWDKKLWTRVPKTFTATKRQEYVFPVPVSAKYVKIEFSYLQAQSYNPGHFQKPIAYKKFPKWVADYFIAQMNLPEFIAKRVGVTYDALDFAYNYYLDDIKEEPNQPVSAPANAAELMSKYFNNISEEESKIDAETLAKINLSLKPFESPPAAQADPETLVGNVTRKVALSESNYPVEEQLASESQNLEYVSSYNRQSVLYEQSMPVMFFFIPCRHEYKEISAEFEYNRAYFAGVKEVAFLRHTYGTEADTELYIENGQDLTNAERNDFVINEEGHWITY